MLAHELRSPLAAVTNAVHVMAATSPSTRHHASARAILTRQTANMTRLIDDLVELSRVTHGLVRLQRERVDLVEALRHVVDATAAERDEQGIELALQLPDGPIWIDADPLRIEQVFTNLLANATKFTPRGGHIRISVTHELRTAESAGAQRPVRWTHAAVVRVRDDGIGIESDMIERIFEPFTQASAGGTSNARGMGLGLALSRQLVELHGGDIRASSAGAGHGSEFIVRLPALAPSPASAEPVSASPNLRVLIVEDNPDVAEALHLMLQLASLEVHVARSGKEAIELADAIVPEIVLLDIGLPDASGWSVARHLRADPRFAPALLIAVSGLGTAEDRHRSHDAGIDYHLTKPLDLQALTGMIEQWQNARDRKTGPRD